MSYIEILILRRLRGGPAHGYELRKRVEETTGFVLHNNSLYPALRRFEEAGAVTKTAEPQEGRPPRLVYTLTEVGQELLHDMVADLPAEQAGDETEFLARLGQFSEINPAERAGIIAAFRTAGGLGGYALKQREPPRSARACHAWRASPDLEQRRVSGRCACW